MTVITCIISAVTGAVLSFVGLKVKQLFKRQRAIEEGMKCLLRNQIINMHTAFSGKEVPLYVKDAVDTSYQAYHVLGGNGTITTLHEDIMESPTEKQTSRVNT